MQRFPQLLLYGPALSLLAGFALSCGGDASSTQEPDASAAPRSEVSIVRPGDPAPPAPRAAETPTQSGPESAAEPREDARVRAARESVERAEQTLASAQDELARAQAVARSGPLPDSLVFREVQRLLLEDPALGHVAIAAEVSDGVVTLRGAVPDASTAEAAIELSAAVRGVQGVRSELRLAN